MDGAKRIIVEYEDGSRREAPFSKLSEKGQSELSALGLCEAPQTGKSYVVLQWKDGWKEVLAVNEKAVEILRYYTIERMEEIGRLSLEIADANPELSFVKRRPADIKDILFVGNEALQAYTLEEKATVKEGGKVEHFFYDKKRPGFSMEEAGTASTRYGAILDTLKAELKKKKLKARAVLAMSEDKRVAVCKELARSSGLRGSERQRDVYGFIQLAMEALGRRDR